MSAPGKYKSLRTARPSEFETAIITTTAVDTEVNDNVDLVLEGQAAMVMSVHWEIFSAYVAATPGADALHDIIAVLSMDETEDTDIDTNYPGMLDDEDLIAFVRWRFNVDFTTSGEAVVPNSFQMDQDFGSVGGILTPETLRLRAIVDAELADVNHSIIARVHYYRIAKPTRDQIDYLYRRR